MADADFDLKAIYNALEEQRLARGMSWTAVAREISHGKTAAHAIGSSTLTRLKNSALAEGDGILQMLRWLDRTPESFLPGFENADAPRFCLPPLPREQILRWDTKALYAALDTQRQVRGMTWKEAGEEIGGFSAGMLRHLAQGGRTSFPGVMRLVRWLDQPAARFTRAAAT